MNGVWKATLNFFMALAAVAGIGCAVLAMSQRHDLATQTSLRINHPTVKTFADLQLPQFDIHEREIPTNGRVLLIYGGNCPLCSLRQIDYTKLPYPDFDAVIVVYSASKKDVLQQFPTQGEAFILSDLTEEASSELTAQWPGRWYKFEQGILTSWQKEQTEAP